VTGPDSTQQSASLAEDSKLRALDSDTKGRMFGLLGLVAFALWIVISICSNLYLSIASTHWPKTTARILSSGVYRNGKGVGVSWNPEVKYQYAIGGTTYQSANVRFMRRVFYDSESANDMQAPYPAGHVVSVSYDPQNPNRSVLEPGLAPGMWTQGLIPLFFIALCGYIFFEITHPERRFLLATVTSGRDYEKDEEGGNEAEMA